MINRCIGCYHHDSKENVCTHGSPIFIDDICTDYQESEFVKQIKADALDIEMDKPMHFTDEQKAWVKKYIAINGERQRADGARKFAEWLPQHFDLRFSSNPDVWLDEFFNHTKDKVLAEWQKRKE